MSGLSSKDLSEKYEYLTGEDLGHKPNVFEKAKFEYSPLGMTLIKNTKSKTNKNKVYNKNKWYQFLVYNSHHSFTKFKDTDEFKELSLDSMYNRLKDFKKRFNGLQTVNPQADKNKDWKLKVLNDAEDLFNWLYYIYQDKYNEEKYNLNTKDKKFFTAKNWGWLMIISTILKKKKKNNRLLKKSLTKKNQLKNQQKMIWANFMNRLIKKKQS